MLTSLGKEVRMEGHLVMSAKEAAAFYTGRKNGFVDSLNRQMRPSSSR